MEEIIHDAVDKPVEPAKKPKDPKRVEQGKRLAEWNRNNKRQKQVQIEYDKPETMVAQNIPKHWFLGGAIVVGGIIVGIFYFRHETKVSTPQITPITKQNDPFDMA